MQKVERFSFEILLLFLRSTVYLNSLSFKFTMIDTSVVNESQQNASEFAKRFPSESEGIALCSVLMLSSVLIIAGNLLALVLFAVTKPLRRKSLFLVMNMAFADLMLGTFSVPFYIYFVGYDYQLWTAKFSFHPMVLRCIDAIFLFGSYLSTAFISCERFYAVYWPFHHRSLSTRTYCIAIFILWTLAVLLPSFLTLFIVFSSFESAFYVAVYVQGCLTIIVCVCNIGIWKNSKHGRFTSQQQNRALQSKRLTKTLLYVSMLALVSWLPLLIMNILISITGEIPPRLVIFVVNILNFSHAFLNPVMYTFGISEFKQTLLLCCTKRGTATKTGKIVERYNRTSPGTPRTEKELRIYRTDPTRLQVVFEQEDIETRF